MTNGKQSKSNATVSRHEKSGKCPSGTIPMGSGSLSCYKVQRDYGATARITDAANKSLPKKNARLVKKVLGGLALAAAAAGSTLTTIAYDTAKTEKNIVKKTLLYAAVLGNAALVVEGVVQSCDLFMEREQQPKLGDQMLPDGKVYL